MLISIGLYVFNVVCATRLEIYRIGPSFFLIFINELPTDMKSQVRIFADDTSLFSVVNRPQICARKLNNDLGRVSEWACQWKMSFNPDITKQAIEINFSKKTAPSNPPQLLFRTN